MNIDQVGPVGAVITGIDLRFLRKYLSMKLKKLS